MTKELRVLELFAGIGACSKALTNLKIPHRIVDAVEIDKYAIKSFNAIHGTDFAPQDISKWDKDVEVDLIMHGSPCQDFSIAGEQRGGDKDSGTRSSLMYETLRIIEKLRPKYVIWENVKNLKSAKHIHNWHAYCARMNELGYSNAGEVLNAKDYGIPQNRERLFTVSYLCDAPRSQFVFPPTFELESTMNDLLELCVDKKYIVNQDVDWIKPRDIANTIRVGGRGSLDRHTWDAIRVVGKLKIKGNDQVKRVYDEYGISPTLTTMGGGNRQPKVLREGRTSTVRRLTPLECWRLMGFDDSDFEKCRAVNSDTQLYKQAGNSIVVDVLMAILRNLLGGKYGRI